MASPGVRSVLLAALSVVFFPGALRAATVETGALVPAAGMMRTVPAFRAAVLSNISLVSSLSVQSAPPLSAFMSAAPTPSDPWHAEAARLVGALAAQPRVVAVHSKELAEALGAQSVDRLKAAAVNLERRAAKDSVLRAQLDGLRSRLDFEDADAAQGLSDRLNALFENAGSRDQGASRDVRASFDPSESTRMPADWKLKPASKEEARAKDRELPRPATPAGASRARSLWLGLPLLLSSGEAFAGFGQVSDIGLVDLVPWVGVLLAGLSFWGALAAGKARRLYGDLPTSKTAGVFMGLVELKGTAEAEKPLKTRLAAERAVYYTWSVSEHWSRTVVSVDKDGKTQTRTETGWETVAEGGKSIPFYLKDDKGIVQVRPDHADVEAREVFSRYVSEGDPLYYGEGPSGSVSGSTGERHFVESAIVLHDPLYIVGPARERADMVAPEIASDGKDETFLISTQSEEAVVSDLRWQFWGLGALGAALSWAGFVAQQFLMDSSLAWAALLASPHGLIAAGAFLGVWFSANAVMMYNGLVALRNRVRQAWANIDVQLKRRADLIPNLVAAVTAIRDHEGKVQETLAELRAQSGATKPGEPGPDPRAVASRIGALAESYPQLKSQEEFLDLMKNISDTEERIALARTYFNDIATSQNIRLEMIPDRFIALLAGMRPQTLLQAGGFERKQSEVALAE